ncbi:MAG: hypothetical protein KAY37_02195 [Phycisphaerae bacterium]|nr:hypothetical protein [Phycisphaerae bacterium]
MKFLEKFWLGCAHCHGGHGCPVAENVDPETGEYRPTVHGAPLVGIVLMVFIVPPLTAIGGAYLAGKWADPSEAALGYWQTGGAVVGFFVGVGLAKLVFWTRRRFSSTDGGSV